MANSTVPFAEAVHGTNPQYLIEKITRLKIYNCDYWKSDCFGLTSETIIDKAVLLKYCGGTYGGNLKPTDFLALTLKLLQLQPEKEIIYTFIQNEDFKYLRLLGALYLRLVGKPAEIYKYLEPLYNDYRKVAYRGASGWTLTHVDEFVDSLLTQELVCDIALPHIAKRIKLEDLGLIQPRRSSLDLDLESFENQINTTNSTNSLSVPSDFEKEDTNDLDETSKIKSEHLQSQKLETFSNETQVGSNVTTCQSLTVENKPNSGDVAVVFDDDDNTEDDQNEEITETKKQDEMQNITKTVKRQRDDSRDRPRTRSRSNSRGHNPNRRQIGDQNEEITETKKQDEMQNITKTVKRQRDDSRDRPRTRSRSNSRGHNPNRRQIGDYDDRRLRRRDDRGDRDSRVRHHRRHDSRDRDHHREYDEGRGVDRQSNRRHSRYDDSGSDGGRQSNRRQRRHNDSDSDGGRQSNRRHSRYDDSDSDGGRQSNRRHSRNDDSGSDRGNRRHSCNDDSGPEGGRESNKRHSRNDVTGMGAVLEPKRARPHEFLESGNELTTVDTNNISISGQSPGATKTQEQPINHSVQSLSEVDFAALDKLKRKNDLKAEKKFNRIFKNNSAPTIEKNLSANSNDPISLKKDNVRPEEFSVEYWNERREALGLKKLNSK